MKELCKRPEKFFISLSQQKKKYKISLDNVEPSKGCLSETPLSYRQTISRSDKEQLVEAMNSEITKIFYDNKTMTFVRKLPKWY